MKIGCDIVENKRLLDKTDSFIDNVLTVKEKQVYLARNKNVEFLAGRFAAKEAIMKCLPNIKEVSFVDIEVLDDEQGKPHTNIENIEDISISHEKEYTIAVALLKD